MRVILLSCAIVVAGSAMPAVENVAGTTTAQGRAEPQSVVWIDASGSQPPQERVVLDQRNVDFFPHVLAVRVGTVVEFPNHDRVFHNVFSFHDGKRFDLGLYPVGTVRRVRFDHPGLSRILCNIHPGMAAYVLVLETAFFAVSDAHGRFEIPRVPFGAHAYHAWRPGRQELAGTVAVGEGTTLDVRW